jgi:hypothetical protein
MRTRLKFVRNLVFAAGVVVALAFGATNAYADEDCSPPITACVGQRPDLCLDFCDEYYNSLGMCNTWDDCCLCLEK